MENCVIKFCVDGVRLIDVVGIGEGKGREDGWRLVWFGCYFLNE